MLLRKRKARDKTAASTLELYYASDVHGSEQCWRKFLGAGRFYGVQALIMARLYSVPSLAQPSGRARNSGAGFLYPVA